MPDSPQITYAAAGVDVEAGDKAVELMKESVRRASRPEVIGGLGGFAGLFDASAIARFAHPVLATSTDGVGTKVAIAQAMDVHHTIGFDLVGMVVDDIVVCGAEPLFMTDYIATGRVVPERIAAIVQGIAAACSECRRAGYTPTASRWCGASSRPLVGSSTATSRSSAALSARSCSPRPGCMPPTCCGW